MNSRHQPDHNLSGPNYGVINSGHISGPVQAATFSQNVTQTNNIAPGLVEHARTTIDALRGQLEGMRDQNPDAERGLHALDAIADRLDEPARDPGAVRFMLDTLMNTCASVPGVLAAAALVHSAVSALLPG